MRWWLTLAFAIVAALTALVVTEVLTRGSDRAFRARAQELVAGRAFNAAIDLSASPAPLGAVVPSVAERHQLALFVFDRRGRLVSPRVSRGVSLAEFDDWPKAVSSALDGQRYAASADELHTSVVALPLADGQRAVLLAYAPDSAAREVGIVHEQVLEASIAAIVAGALLGLVIATLIAIRLGRVARTAAAIEAGSFETELQPRFCDELGRLAETIDRMRRRLRGSFAQLDSERTRLARLLARLHQGVVAVDRDLRVEFANDAARDFLAAGPLGEHDPLPAVWGGVDLHAFVAHLFEEDASVTELRLSPDADRTWALAGVPVRDGDSAILVLTDVTVQERRERAEREFVENAAHELRTPLTTIRAAIESLEAGMKDDPDERDRFLAHIDRESVRLTHLIHALLTLARAQTKSEAAPLEPIPLRPLLEEVAAGLVSADGVEVRVDCDPGLAVRTNRYLAWEAIANLAQNAAKHTDTGLISLSASSGRNGHVTVRVSDTGHGIGRDEAERVFDRFYRADGRGADGFGLGLSIVRQAVDALGGEVRIESEPGVGTTATVLLPRAASR
jgi:signal transduction histidine kinase